MTGVQTCALPIFRGVFFANVGGGWFNGQQSADPCGAGSYKFVTKQPEVCTPVIGYKTDQLGVPLIDPKTQVPILQYGAPTTISGLRLQDGRASYGVGLETFALGFPIHFDWSWRTLLNKSWEDVVFAGDGGSASFRKPRFAVWIGYDF